MEKQNIFYNLLSKPCIYRTLQTLVGGREPIPYKLIKHLCQNFKINNGRKPRLLDLGCGEGELCASIHSYCDYTGLDYSEEYLNHAKEKYGGQASFYKVAPIQH